MHPAALDHGALPRPLAGALPLSGRQLGRWLGWPLTGLSFWFVGVRLWRDAPFDLVRTHLGPALLATIAGALLYGAAGFLLAAAWRQILAAERPPGPAAGYHAVYGRTQIAKYLPGNCFHFVGRQMLGGALGHSQAGLALASLVETALLVAIATGLALPLAAARLGAWTVLVPAGALAMVALLLFAPRLLPVGLWPDRASARRRLPAGNLLCAVAAQAAFFCIMGGILWLLAALLGDHRPGALDPLTSISALALAWVIGFVTPGASAGIGVREAVLILVLEGALGAEASAAAALALRLVTTAGDGIFFGLALALPLPSRPDPSPALPALQSKSKYSLPG